MGKDTEFQNRAGLPYRKVAGSAAQFDTERQRLNYTSVIEGLTKQLQDKDAVLRLAVEQNADLRERLADLDARNLRLTQGIMEWVAEVKLKGSTFEVLEALAQKDHVHTPSHCSKCASGPAGGHPHPEK